MCTVTVVSAIEVTDYDGEDGTDGALNTMVGPVESLHAMASLHTDYTM
jgi:hypothetical protein